MNCKKRPAEAFANAIKWFEMKKLETDGGKWLQNKCHLSRCNF